MTPRELLVPSELRQLRSQLSDALEASDGAISDEFDSRTRNDIRAEIARKSAALIHQARHGNWNAAALREALASWRLLTRLEENARPGGGQFALHRRRQHRFYLAKRRADFCRRGEICAIRANQHYGWLRSRCGIGRGFAGNVSSPISGRSSSRGLVVCAAVYGRSVPVQPDFFW